MPELRLVCVIDDDENVRESLGDLLEGCHYRAGRFACAEDLLASAQLAEAGCIITDYHMPGMTGLGLVAALRARGIAVPVILMTAFATERLREMAHGAGVSALLKKPFHPDEMLRLVAQAVGGG